MDSRLNGFIARFSRRFRAFWKGKRCGGCCFYAEIKGRKYGMCICDPEGQITRRGHLAKRRAASPICGHYVAPMKVYEWREIEEAAADNRPC